MSKLPDKIVRFDVLRVEHGKKKLCTCAYPHYEIDYQNRLVWCSDCGAIVDAFEALNRIARDTERQEQYLETFLEQRRQIDSYQSRRVVIKELEKRYVRGERDGLEPVCPHCRKPFHLKDLVSGMWCNPEFFNENG